MRTEPKRRRGQSSGEIILRLFVLILVGGPIITAMIRFQSELADSRLFSWLGALFIALLLFAAIVAAILGLD